MPLVRFHSRKRDSQDFLNSKEPGAAIRTKSLVHSLVMKTGFVLAVAAFLVLMPASWAQNGRSLNPDQVAQRTATEKELESVAIIERKVMVPMRDGKRMAADIYRPKDESQKYPIIFSRTPYNFNYWDVRNGTYTDMSTPLAAVKRGYAYVVMNE